MDIYQVTVHFECTNRSPTNIRTDEHYNAYYVISQLSMAFPIFLHKQTQNINCAYQNLIKIIFRTCFDLTCARLGACDVQCNFNSLRSYSKIILQAYLPTSWVSASHKSVLAIVATGSQQAFHLATQEIN